MNRRQMIAAVTEKLNIKLDENDPAFVLVELNRLALDEAGRHIIDQLEGIPDRIREAVDQSLSFMLEDIKAIDEQQKTLMKFYQSLPDRLNSEQEASPSSTDAADGASEESSAKTSPEIDDASTAMRERLAWFEAESLKVYQEKEALKSMIDRFESEKRNFDQLSLWDRIFFKL